jgi:beta-mannosidase
VYATFVMQTVVDEDQSRVAWPSCPSNGWVAGVDRLSAHPNGSPLGLLPNARPPPAALGAPPSCQLVEGSDIDGDGVAPWSTPGASAADCCAQCNRAPGCAGVVYEAAGTSNCWFKADGGAPSPRANRTACINNNHRKSNTIEVHGPYQHGSGWPGVNGGGTSDLNPFPPGYPLAVDPTVAMGPQWPNQFASEFGGSVWSSFESLAPTLAPAHWGIHGGGPPDVCGRGFEADCNGTNVAAQRNYPTDNYLSVYFGDGVDRTAVGEFAFKAQLFQSMVGQALNVAMKITSKRLTNCFGTMVWQLGEIWPTGGWGSLEYATAAFTPGQILGGRWKPLHYWYRKALFTRVFATCGAGGHCMVKNDAVGPLAGAALAVSKVALATGVVTPVHADASLSLPPGPGAAAFFTIDPAIDGAQFVLTARVTAASGEVLTDNLIPLLPPAAWSGLGRATVTAVVDAAPSGPNGEVGITLTSDKVAAFVTLTTMAQGRFSDNAFLMLPGTQRVAFIPWAAGQAPVLQETLRVEHMASYM